MGRFTVLLDSSVLYPAPLRDLLLELAVHDLYRVRWSAMIHCEWMESLLKKRPELQREHLERTRYLMDKAARDAVVTGFEYLIPTLALPDPNDRHVLAAAIHGRADMIVTANLKDFPEEILQGKGMEAKHPDDFLMDQFHLSQRHFLAAVKAVRQRLKNPPKSAASYLDTLHAQGLVKTVKEIEQSVDDI